MLKNGPIRWQPEVEYQKLLEKMRRWGGTDVKSAGDFKGIIPEVECQNFLEIWDIGMEQKCAGEFKGIFIWPPQG